MIDGCFQELNGRRIRVDYSVTERPHQPTPGEYMGLRRSDYGRGDDRRGGRRDDRSRYDRDRDYVPNGPMPKEFRNHLTLNFSRDGLVYAADRGANRIHVTTKDGKFVKEFILFPPSCKDPICAGASYAQ